MGGAAGTGDLFAEEQVVEVIVGRLVHLGDKARRAAMVLVDKIGCPASAFGDELSI